MGRTGLACVDLVVSGRDCAVRNAIVRTKRRHDTFRRGKKGKITIMPAGGEVGFQREIAALSEPRRPAPGASIFQLFAAARAPPPRLYME
jgi:hypothetical protein